jgi:hypothetical protein
MASAVLYTPRVVVSPDSLKTWGKTCHEHVNAQVTNYSVVIPRRPEPKAAAIFFRPTAQAAARISSLCQQGNYTTSDVTRWLIAKGWETAFGEDLNAPIVVPQEKTP